MDNFAGPWCGLVDDDPRLYDHVAPSARTKRAKFSFTYWTNFLVKGVGMPWAKKLILVVSNRGAQDKLFGVVLTL